MITRIVKLTFHPGKTGNFEQIFTRSKEVIAAQPGCQSVSAYRDNEYDNIYFTISTWENTEALDLYRKSPFFKDTWKETKALFSARPEAWTLNPLTTEMI